MSLTQDVPALAASLRELSMNVTDGKAFRSVTTFCKEHWVFPIVVCAGYLAMVYATRRPTGRYPFPVLVDRCFALWNLGLSLFSCWGFYHMAVGLQQGVQAFGLQYSICGDTQVLIKSFRGPAALALCLFCFSKIPEFGDTVFLILKGKKVRFLQWYHHATVMLFCWMALGTEYTPGLWFAATNYFVHSVMYMYFFLMTFKTGASIIKPIAPLITIIQIAQMVWGLIVNAIAVGTYFTTGNCQIQAVTVYAAMIMYASYFYLFSQLFFEARGAAGPKKNNRETVRELSRKISEALMESTEEVNRHMKVN